MSQPFSSEKAEAVADLPSVIEATLTNRGEALVHETRFQDELRSRGFGEKEDSQYVLKSYECLYLLQRGRLSLTNAPTMSFGSLVDSLTKHARNVMTTFLVYRDLRTRGYVAKEGFGFGIDFRVYERGEYETKPAKYVVFGINEGTDLNARSFASIIEQIEKMGKEAVIAVIERRGEVIYYKASKMRFTENRHSK